MVPATELEEPLGQRAPGNPFCALLRRTVAGQAQCRAAHAAAQQRAVCSGVPVTLLCHAGLRSLVIPLIVAGKPAGALVAGRVVDRPLTPASFQRAAAQLVRLGLDPRPFKAAFFQTHVVPPKTFAAIQRLLLLFAQQMIERATRAALQPGAAEPPAVAEARRFIAANCHEHIAMTDVARHVHLSAHHFSRLFKNNAGITFTEFVNAMRVEKARQLLCDRCRHIFEIAYAVGFESIPHFNRVFRRHAGLSPTRFRAALGMENCPTTRVRDRQANGRKRGVKVQRRAARRDDEPWSI